MFQFKQQYIRYFLALLIPVMAVFMAYSPVYHAPFIWDDYNFLLEWPPMHSLNNFPRLLAGDLPPQHGGVYRPLRSVYQAVSYQLFKQNASAYHIQAVILHATITAIVFFVLLKLLQLFDSHIETANERKKYSDLALSKSQLMLAFVGTLFFALHPMTTEAIAFIQASFDTTGHFFALLSYYFFLRLLPHLVGNTNDHIHFFVDWNISKKSIVAIIENFFLSTLFATIAFLFYELTVPIVGIMMITFSLYMTRFHSSTIRSISLKIVIIFVPIILCFLGIIGVRFFILGVQQRVLDSPNYWFTFLAMTRSLLLYITQTIFPIHLSFIHEIAPAITTIVGDSEFYAKLKLTDWQTLISLSSISILFFLALKKCRNNPLFSLGVCWFFVGLTPVLNIIPSGTIYSERYIYFSLIGFILVILSLSVALLQRIKSRDIRLELLLALSVLISFTYGLRTFMRAIDWSDPIYFWTKEATHLPKIGNIRNALGVELNRTSRKQDALNEFLMAVRLQPYEADFYYNAALVYKNLKQYPQAAYYAEQSLIWEPQDTGPLNYRNLTQLLEIYDLLKNPAHSQQFYLQYTQQRKANPVFYYLLGNTSIRLGQTATAEAALRQAIAGNPGYEEAYTNLGALLNSVSRYSDAITVLETARKKGIKNSNLFYNLAVSYIRSKDASHAAEVVDEARIENPFDKSIEQLYERLQGTSSANPSLPVPDK